MSMSIRFHMSAIDSSDETAIRLRAAAQRIADLADGNDVLRDEVRRLEHMATEYEIDADEKREAVMDQFGPDAVDQYLGA